jgi:hypothetical protein
MTSQNLPAPNERISRNPFAVLARLLLILAAVGFLFATPVPLSAQTGGEAGISGAVTDPTGAAVPKATVTATNNATNVSTVRESSGSGLFTISPVIPGTYTVTVKAAGFKTFVQKNLSADALKMTGLDVTLTVGDSTTEVEVTSAPPSLDTTSAAIVLTIENDTYAGLPIVTTGAMRDPTAFATLAPGTQGGARLPIVGGIGNYLGQLYLDGLPAETINQQADNRVVSQAVSVDAVDQFQEVTSSPPVEYSGAGATNITMKSGGLKYHGQVSDFIRNTAFDLNGFANKATLVTNAAGQRVFAPKPVDHQNEFSASVGGHIPYTKRVFFFVAYDKFHNRSASNPAQFTIPTAQERAGDFTQLACLNLAPALQAACIQSGGPTGNGVFGTDANGNPVSNTAFLYDPTSNVCVTPSSCNRTAFQGTKGGLPTNNVIPANYISPFAQKAQSFLPDVTTTNVLTNNFTATLPGGFDNHAIDWRVDFDINAKQRISTVGAMGAVNYFNNFNAPNLPQPYTGGDLAAIFPKVYDVEHTYTISNSMVNQFKFGFVRFYMDIADSTDGVSAYSPTTLGLTNLPAGQAGREFPGVSFATTTKFGTPQQYWTGTTTAPSAAVSTQLTTPNNFTLVDNFQYTKGAHNITAGIQIQWQQINNANPATASGFLILPFNANSTANFTGGTISTAATGYSYASYLLGAVGSTSLSIQPLAETGGRYLPFAPYVSDTWKVSSKLTVDAGLRWDYLPPFHEVLDRWSFLNPTLTNAATGTLGALQFAGNYGGPGVSCGCRTPVQTYWKNFGPRLGVTFSPNPTTVFRAGIGHVYSQGGGVGGRGGAANGTGGLGFNTTATSTAESTSGMSAGPSYYLNNSAYFTSIGKANTGLFNGNPYPSAPVPGAASQILDTGNYLNSTGTFVTPSSAPGYADPYFSGRAPDFTFYNFGIQQALTRNLTLAINYVGNQSHHLYNSTAGGGNIRGYWANQLNPVYLASLASVTNATCDPTQVAKTCSALLSSQATPANIAKAQAAMPGLVVPAFYAAGAAVNGSATIAQALVAFPQYSSVSDTWGVNTANFNYNSMQVSLDQRNFHGLTYNVNYTWSKNVGDDGTFRSGFDIPAAAISGGTQSYHQDRIERTDTTISQRHVAHAFGVYRLPFGEGRLGGQNVITHQILGGWQTGFIFTYGSGIPLAVVAASCTSPGQGQCTPNVNPLFAGNAHIGGGYGRDASGHRSACAIGQGTIDGTTGGTSCSSIAIKYIDPNAFQAVPNSLAYLGTGAPLSQLLGNAPRTGAFHLTGPASTDVDANLKRTIKLHDRYSVQLEADVINVANHTIFSNPNVSFGNAAFGTVTSVSNKPRSFQVAAHFNF